jgi:AI-2 transport protein TqsA
VLFWGWIWGVPGALIAVPLTVTPILVCANTDALRPVAVLLSEEADIDEPGQRRD